MSIQRNSDGSYTITPRKPGVEAAAFGAGFAPDLGEPGALNGIETAGEVATGGFLSYAIYSAVMAALETTPARRAGEITAAEQREVIMNRAWDATKSSVPTVLILAAVLGICPWLGGVAAIGGFVGGTVMTVRLVRTGWEALSEDQRQAITVKATEVGVSMPEEFGGAPAPAGA